MKLITGIQLFSLLILSGSCSTDNDLDPVPTGKSPILFSTATESRGTTVGKDDIESFRLYAYQFHNNTDPFCSINGELVYPTDNDDWRTDETYYWPDKSRTLQFIAHAPADDDNLKLVNDWESDPQEIYYYYSCPQDVRKQKDILFAFTNQRVNYGGPSQRVPLWFTHILANVRDAIKGTDATGIESVTIKGIYGEGMYYPAWNNWHLYGYNGQPAYTTHYTVTISPDGRISDDQLMMVIPQTTPPGATIELRMRDGTYQSSDCSYKTLHAGAVNTINLKIN